VSYVPDPDNLSEVDRYWVGYFRADGCISKQTGTAMFAQSTKEPVAGFVSYLGLTEERCRHFTYSAQPPSRSERKTYQGYRVSSLPLGRIYSALGVKTLLTDESLYDDLDFWRGMIDGDGCIHHSKQGVIVLSFCGVLYEVDKFADFCHKLFDKRPTVRPNHSIFQTGVGGDKAKYLCRLLYSGKYSALPYKRSLALLAAGLPYGREGYHQRYKVEERRASAELL
jgi:hypothetical protein